MGTPLHHQPDLIWSSSVTSILSDDLEAFLQLLPAQHILLRVTYPSALNIAREQQEHLARALFSQGLKRSALLIESAARYLVFSEPREAWDTYCCLRYSSLAIEVGICRVGVYRESLANLRTRSTATAYPAPSNQPTATVDDARNPV
ncbi:MULTISPECIES: hypothetical protein [Pseudomonas]|uniref:Uncharacterized protein n=1 Tax=Pseudomonas citronellolis TaxID=53408 RepID=A0A1A9KH20_9PSED|nr:MULTISPECIES: hypothetical protein [Pseudomonas]ANI16283.1 hypothetical protein A9C11_20920 [Pseudomonas citronellolis]EJU9614679.1 hypothetical protein [Pseudomonas aeruginosa]EKU2931443.1 hypothetical protein [Pseudomonas aeruginosa]ELM0223549.1 hypothetical protein [Pseudomonas aeruginosa]KES24224.1 hypothetical protein FG99_10675 [Pseudomonas sp. AAC]